MLAIVLLSATLRPTGADSEEVLFAASSMVNTRCVEEALTPSCSIFHRGQARGTTRQERKRERQ